jgi:hypothetical protein
VSEQSDLVMVTIKLTKTSIALKAAVAVIAFSAKVNIDSQLNDFDKAISEALDVIEKMVQK